jgi:hypothetical protein
LSSTATAQPASSPDTSASSTAAAQSASSFHNSSGAGSGSTTAAQGSTLARIAPTQTSGPQQHTAGSNSIAAAPKSTADNDWKTKALNQALLQRAALSYSKIAQRANGTDTQVGSGLLSGLQIANRVLQGTPKPAQSQVSATTSATGDPASTLLTASGSWLAGSANAMTTQLLQSAPNSAQRGIFGFKANTAAGEQVSASLVLPHPLLSSRTNAQSGTQPLQDSPKRTQVQSPETNDRPTKAEQASVSLVSRFYKVPLNLAAASSDEGNDTQDTAPGQAPWALTTTTSVKGNTLKIIV